MSLCSIEQTSNYLFVQIELFFIIVWSRMVSTKMGQYQHIRKGISNHAAIDNNDENKKKNTQQNFFSFQYAMNYQIICIGDQKETLL